MNAWVLETISEGKKLMSYLLSNSIYDNKIPTISNSMYDSQITNSWNNKVPVQQLNVYVFKIKEWYKRGNYLAVKINYPGSKHYEGNKILVYENTTIEKLKDMISIDPHFASNKEKPSPIARFEASEEGWVNAMKFCSMLHSERLELEY